ncbi:hypothetical protein BS50DRAFT_50001 [Corynespora cassiicola Philippines]|uniref:Uncharacterized protein n=1 Tax=Corynespora cassiicola Philippines TaxID=1448308 RepID=A0A2T2NI49_CORCC|nr:hypothetical protein BS50DRAFT_50001 [Corynespora cassiicola Philippines]
MCDISHKSFNWDEFNIPFEYRVLVGRRNLPEPKITYAFPIVQTPHPGETKGFARDELGQALTPQVLKKLVQQGISCAPTTAIEEGTNLRSKVPLMGSTKPCFPWAIVEMNHDGPTSSRSDEICYCQAANTAAAALQIQTQLFNSLGKDAIFQPPPVIVFTCVGPIVKVWLAYESSPSLFSSPSQRMVCIWSTSAQLTWGIASLRAIIMNMKTWASRILKPRIQTCALQASKKTGQIPPQTITIPNPTSSIFSCLPTASSASLPSSLGQSASAFSPSDRKTASTKNMTKGDLFGTLQTTPQDSIPDDSHRSHDDLQVDTSGRIKSPSDCNVLLLRPKSPQPNDSTKSPSSASKAVPASVSKSLPTNPAASPQPSSGHTISAPRFNSSDFTFNSSDFTFNSSDFTFNSSPVISMFNKGVDFSKIPPNKFPTPSSSSSSSRGSSMQPDKPATSQNPTLLAFSTSTQGPPVPESADEVTPSNQTPEEERLPARIAALKNLKHIKVTDPGHQAGPSEMYDMIQADVEKVVDDLKLNLQKDLSQIYERHYRAALGGARKSGEMNGAKDVNRNGGSQDEEKATENSDGAEARKSDEQKPTDSTQKEPKPDNPKDKDSEPDNTKALGKDSNPTERVTSPGKATEAEDSRDSSPKLGSREESVVRTVKNEENSQRSGRNLLFLPHSGFFGSQKESLP